MAGLAPVRLVRNGICQQHSALDNSGPGVSDTVTGPCRYSHLYLGAARRMGRRMAVTGVPRWWFQKLGMDGDHTSQAIFIRPIRVWAADDVRSSSFRL